MCGVNDDGKMVTMIRESTQAAQINCVPAYSNIGSAFLNTAHDFPDFAFFQADANVAIVLCEQAYVLGQKLRHRRLAAEHAHMALHAIGESAQFGLHPVEQLQRFTRIAV